DFGFLIGMFLLTLWVGAFDAQTRRFAGQGRALDQWRAGMVERGPLTFHGLEEAVRRIPPAPAATAGAGALPTPGAGGARPRAPLAPALPPGRLPFPPAAPRPSAPRPPFS